jgi:hypothetical protein
MTTHLTRWIAGTGLVTPVVILEAGTGGQELNYVPPDPVVVRSVSDYFEFVASESALFTDKGLAMKEANRLREEELLKAKRLLAQIERREVLEARALEEGAKIIEDAANLIEDIDTSPPQPVVKMSQESSVTVESPVEVVVVTKKSIPEETEKPKTLLERILYVVGRETLGFDEICQRLKARGWMPKRRSSVSNVLSGRKNMFHCPAKSTYSLRNKPKVSPVESDEVTLQEASTDVTETDEVSEEVEAEFGVSDEGTTVLDAEFEVVDDGVPGEPEAEVSSPVDSPTEDDEPSEFDTWLGMPMTSLSPTRAHYHDDGLVLAEKSNGDGKWTAEIHVEGLALWSEGSSLDRQEARELAQRKLNEQTESVQSTLERLQGL